MRSCAIPIESLSLLSNHELEKQTAVYLDEQDDQPVVEEIVHNR